MATSDEFTNALLLLRKWKEEGTALLWHSYHFGPYGRWISFRSERSPIMSLTDLSGSLFEACVGISTRRRIWTVKSSEIQEVGGNFLKYTLGSGFGDYRNEHFVSVPGEDEL